MEELEIIHWLTTSLQGLLLLCVVGSVISILFIERLKNLLKWIIKPTVDRTFYDTILDNYLGPFFSKHKIIATFIKVQGLGESVVDGILYLIGTFTVVAFLSSALTALLFYLMDEGFVYSLYLLWLVSTVSMLVWVLIHNMIYFYRLIHRSG